MRLSSSRRWQSNEEDSRKLNAFRETMEKLASSTEDSGTELQQVEAPGVVVAISAEIVDAVFTTDTLHSLSRGLLLEICM